MARVLVVDDSIPVRAMLREQLEILGHEVVEAEDGASCLALLREQSADLILLDGSMPGLSGFEVCERLKADQRTREIPVAFLTALSQDADHARALEAGANGFLQKPCPAPVLKAQIDNLLNVAHLTEALHRIKRNLERYVPEEAARILNENPDARPALTGERTGLSVLFSDIRGFTRYSEHHDPETVFRVLNTTLSFQAELVRTEGGDIDKYIGDSLMAIFRGDDGLARAAAAGVLIASVANARLARDEPTLAIGVGVCQGPVVAGNVGNVGRMDFTVIGDTVNTAARLCSAARGGEFLLPWDDAETLPMLPQAERREITVKGKERPLQVAVFRGAAEPEAGRDLARAMTGKRAAAGVAAPTAGRPA